MFVDIKFQKEDQTATLEYKIKDFKDKLAKVESLAILSTFAADFYLDPELDLADLEDFLTKANEEKKESLVFILHEEGLELEFK